MNKQIILQNKLFQHLVSVKGQQRVLQESMDVLNLKKGALYKRMNGNTALTASELINISDHFHISLDDVLLSDKLVSFRHQALRNESTKGTDFLVLIDTYMTMLNHDDNSKLLYLANELPLFYYISREYIFNFLVSVWNHLHWEEGTLCIDERSHLGDMVNHYKKEISDYYENCPVTEIWNSNMLADLYQKIIFCVTIRAFANVAFIDKLILDIEELIESLKKITLEGVWNSNRTDKIDLKIYLNEFGSYLNMALYESDNYKNTFIGFDYPQFIVSGNHEFYEYALNWTEKIKRRSVLISSEGLQNRELFFMKMESDFQNFKDRVHKFIEVYYPKI